MESLSERGYVVAGIIWLMIIIFVPSMLGCTKYQPCSTNDVIGAAVMGGTFLIPARLGAWFLGSIFPSLLGKDDQK